jgi:hypothetical protein
MATEGGYWRRDHAARMTNEKTSTNDGKPVLR